MWNSQYVASRLGLYHTEKGKLQLDTLLSKVGISPEHRKAAYAALPDADRRSLASKLEDHGRAYGLRELTFRSFVKYQGYGSALSAVDMVYCVGALLGQPAEEEGEFRRHFWAAYEALRSDAGPMAKSGLELAKALQAAMARQAAQLLAKGGLVHCGAFRVAYLGATTDAGDLDCLRSPGALTRMARFLAELKAGQTAKAGARPVPDKPLVLAACNPKAGTWTVVGVPRDRGDGTVERNKFAVTFRQAAVKSRAQCVGEGIEPACVEVRQDSLRPFMDAVLYHTSAEP
eukprot:TRINITY_DN9274_c0_g1_i1.p1 TRINITY_DN9274_c0_g1~~TRINITY_DN9274_c0_g1_i1.p1  ORF type:complete len:324 (-),score=69.82 TRINITY_DN9274_c0_g1_i1:418-1281(-)